MISLGLRADSEWADRVEPWRPFLLYTAAGPVSARSVCRLGVSEGKIHARHWRRDVAHVAHMSRGLVHIETYCALVHS